MFDTQQQFFPTPYKIASQVWLKLAALGVSKSRVLDPSAGKGDLLTPGADYAGRYSCLDAYAVEIDPDLQVILREKGITVIGSDFLEFDEPVEFSAIVMNPPFNRGVDHVLHAFRFLEDGGGLVALLNAETVANPHTKERQRLATLIEQYGGSENLGQCFKTAERKTDVEVVMIWLCKPKSTKDSSSFQFSGDFKPADDGNYEEFAANPLASVDAVDNLVNQYRAALSALKARYGASSELRFHLFSLPSSSQREDKLMDKGDYFQDVQHLKYRFWWAVFKLSRMSEISTSDFRKKFDEFVKGQVHMAFNKSNILEALSLFFQNKEQIMLDSVVSVFDQATEYHESNITHKEGWKSNSGWKINPKIVIPHGVYWNKTLNWWDAGWGAKSEAFIRDLDEVLHWIAGEEYDSSYSSAVKIKYNSDIQPGEWVERRFYSFKLFKKGTVHVRFDDLYLLDDFNAIASKGKRWIGGEGF
jgi:hypothetical protein